MKKKIYLSKVIQELHGMYNKPETHVVINDTTEEPVLAILPYKEYLRLTSNNGSIILDSEQIKED